MVRTLAGLVLALSGVLSIDSPAQAAGDFPTGYSPRAGVSLHGSTGGYCSPSFRHQHIFHTYVDRVWVAPVYRPWIVGYDRCGNPIYDQMLVCAGYWKTVVVHRCSCGLSY